MTATRLALVRSLRRQEQRDQIGQLLTPLARTLLSIEASTLLSLSKAARAAGRHQIALNAIVQARRLPDHEEDMDTTLEYAMVLWMCQETATAMQLLKVKLPLLEQDTTNRSRIAQKARVYALLVGLPYR